MCDWLRVHVVELMEPSCLIYSLSNCKFDTHIEIGTVNSLSYCLFINSYYEKTQLAVFALQTYIKQNDKIQNAIDKIELCIPCKKDTNKIYS